MGRCKGFAWVTLGRLCLTIHPLLWHSFGSTREAGLHAISVGCVTLEWSY